MPKNYTFANDKEKQIMIQGFQVIFDQISS
jgi:hypothetical protein